MSQSILLIGFAVWLLYQAWRGYKRGLWVTVISGIAVVVAYLVSLFAGPKLAAVVEGFGIQSYLGLAVAFPITFFAAYYMLIKLPFVFIPSLRAESHRRALLGSAVGAGVGCVSGLIVVWFVNLLLSMQTLSQPSLASAEQAAPASLVQSASGALNQLATGFVAGTVEAVADVAGAEDEQLVMMSAVIREPTVVIGGMRDIMQSPEMAGLLRSEKTTSMMAINDVNSLKSSDEFSALVKLPAMQNMLSYLKTDMAKDSKDALAEQTDGSLFVAEQLTYVWRRMAYLKTDPRFIELTSDDDLQAALRANNPVKLMANTKFQRLASLVLDGADGLDEQQLSSVLSGQNSDGRPVFNTMHNEGGAELSDRSMLDSQSYTPQIVFKWQDNEGQWRYSDWEKIPLDKRSTAQKLRR